MCVETPWVPPRVRSRTNNAHSYGFQQYPIRPAPRQHHGDLGAPRPFKGDPVSLGPAVESATPGVPVRPQSVARRPKPFQARNEPVLFVPQKIILKNTIFD